VRVLSVFRVKRNFSAFYVMKCNKNQRMFLSEAWLSAYIILHIDALSNFSRRASLPNSLGFGVALSDSLAL
jgi:hypothetical protein